MDIKDAKLKPCPLCGGEVSVASGSDSGEMYYMITRGTSKENRCTCRLLLESGRFPMYASEERRSSELKCLISKWNSRHPGNHYGNGFSDDEERVIKFIENIKNMLDELEKCIVMSWV